MKLWHYGVEQEREGAKGRVATPDTKASEKKTKTKRAEEEEEEEEVERVNVKKGSMNSHLSGQRDIHT